MTTFSKIYVADLVAYNAGTLCGIWIDATKEPEQIQAEVQAMLSGSPEPIAGDGPCTTTKALAGCISANGRTSKKVHKIGMLIEKHDALAAELLSHWNNDVDEVRPTPNR